MKIRNLFFAISLLFLTPNTSVANGEYSPIKQLPFESSIQAKNKGALQVASVVCYLKGERSSGMNKICYYDCMGSDAAITISSVALCPLSINQ